MFLFAKHAAEEKIGVREQLWGVGLFRVGPRQHLGGFFKPKTDL
jgi:hypothetical protein